MRSSLQRVVFALALTGALIVNVQPAHAGESCSPLMTAIDALK